MSRAARSALDVVAGDLAISSELSSSSLTESTSAPSIGNAAQQRSACASREVFRRLLLRFDVYSQTLLQTARLCASSAASAPVGKQPACISLVSLAFGLLARLASLAPERFCAPISLSSPQTSAASSSLELTALMSSRTSSSSLASDSLHLLLIIQRESKLPLRMLFVSTEKNVFFFEVIILYYRYHYVFF